MNHVDPIIELRDIQVRIGSQVVLSDMNWELSPGENWAILGANGAGKTTFLRLVRGDIWPTPGRGTRAYYVNGAITSSPIRFRTQAGIVSSDLLDQYRRMGWNVTGSDVILSGFWGTAYVHQRPDAFQIEQTRSIIETLRLEQLAQRRVLTLSRGESKRILIARALVHNPKLLILDEVCESLDESAKECVLDTIQEIAEKGTQLLYATHNTEDLVPAVTHILKLDAGRIVNRDAREQVSLPEREPIVVSAKQVKSHIRAARQEVNDNEFLIRIKDTDVYLGGRKILHDLNWTIEPGENWAVLGENGSGKTTLLKLLIGDVKPRHGGSILRFGNNNLKTIWEIRRRISLVSADLQAIHMNSQTGLQTVVSGFFGSIGLHDTPDQQQVRTAGDWITLLGLDSLAERDIQTLSYGQLRMLLIARATVTNPDILLLDEPTAGLDVSATRNTLSLVESLTRHGTSIVYVTHQQELIPRCITNVAVMQVGRLSVKESRRQFESLECCRRR